jgi:alpha-L-fucosidase
MTPEWFSKAKLGIFITWGIYAVEGVLESWAFTYPNMTSDDYYKQLDGFTARGYNPAEWAELFKKAGARYAVLTTKHHDGVALWDTGAGNLSVVKNTPAGRDLVKPYCDALREAGLKVGLYFSHTDWSMDEHLSVICDRPKEEIRALRSQKTTFYKMWGEVLKRPPGENRITTDQKQSWDRFMKLYLGQIQELVHNFSPIDVFWGDGMFERSGFDWQKERVRDLLKASNPEMIIARLPGYSDMETPEVRFPCSPVSSGPWEYCTTVSNSWGYRRNEVNNKTPVQVIRMFCDVLALGGTMLLDVGPREDGTIEEKQAEALLGLGAFIDRNREAIYDTVRGLDRRFYDGGSVFNPDKRTLYLFVHDIPREGVMVKGIDTPIRKCSVLSSGEELRVQYFFGRGYGCFWIHTRQEMAADGPFVIKVEFEEPVEAVDKWGMLWENNGPSR